MAEPLTQRLPLARMLAPAGMVVYTLVMLARALQGKFVFPDQLFLIFLIAVLLWWQRSGALRLFLVDWLPWISFVALYDLMRGVAPQWYDRVRITQPYQWEVRWFGWLAGGEAPALAVQSWITAHGHTALKTSLDIVLASVYVLHFVMPMVLMWVLWGVRKDRRLFYRFSYTLAVLNYMALATFAIFPAGPPWFYQSLHGNLQAAPDLRQAAGGLLALDHLLNLPLFQSIWGGVNPNHFAAIPSLHGTWPVAVTMFSVAAFGRRGWLTVIYPMLAAVAGVYLNHHYIIDYVIGWIYLAIAYLVVERLLMPKVFDRLIDYARLADATRR